MPLVDGGWCMADWCMAILGEQGMPLVENVRGEACANMPKQRGAATAPAQTDGRGKHARIANISARLAKISARIATVSARIAKISARVAMANRLRNSAFAN